jgi:UPF0755 protein
MDYKVFYLIVAFIILILISFAYFNYRACNSYTSAFVDYPLLFEIEKDNGISAIADKLENKQIFTKPLGFKYCVWRKGVKSDLQAGEYIIDGRTRIGDLIDTFSKGEVSPLEVKVTILEGWSNKQIADDLEVREIMTQNDFLKFTLKASDYSNEYAFLSDLPKDSSLQGFLYPDTYFYNLEKNNGQDLVKKALDNFNAKMTPELLQAIEDQNKTLYEILIMASIVEKESKYQDEAKTIAGVFYNRLAKGQKLESDATITYLTGKKDPSASLEDLAIDSPYNTYKYEGLPPGPIGNPSLNAIEAAIYPEKHDFYYFLHEQNEGKAIFSKTLEEHNENKAKYLR